MRIACLLVMGAAGLMALTPDQLVDLAKKGGASRTAIVETLGDTALLAGTAYAGHGEDFLWAVRYEGTAPELFVDGKTRGLMKRVPGTPALWMMTGKAEAGTSHSFYYKVGKGSMLGGQTDVPAYLEDCYEKPGVPKGTLSEKLEFTSQIYGGMKNNYWIYVPAQYNASKPAALMVWQDGEGHIRRDGGARTLNVVDNLIHQGKIPVMILVLIQPGMKGDRPWRAEEYDVVDDTYARYLRDEIVAEVSKKYNIRKDGYSRGIAGNSSGGICAFNVAWQQQDQFQRVLSHIGSFTSIRWISSKRDGGNDFPFKIRKEPKRNIRVWLQDGANDLENEHGSWPLQNLQMANSLKRMGYDYHLSFGTGTHNGAHGNAELPRSLTWLWRGYDASKTSDEYVQEASEVDQPLYRVRGLSR